jgi:hypothetical protein
VGSLLDWQFAKIADTWFFLSDVATDGTTFFKRTVLARATSEARTRGSIPVARAEGIEEASLEGYQFG